MSLYFWVLIISCIGTRFSEVFILKKYQLEKGSSFRANAMYLILGGMVYATVCSLILLITGKPLSFSWYSFLFAIAVVAGAGIYTIFLNKSYASGQIATAQIFSNMGTIILTCAWGVLLLDETLSVFKAVSILHMLVSLLLITDRKGEKVDLKLLWVYALVIIFSSFVTLLYKYHQTSAPELAVDPFSFNVWVGLIRAVLFSMFIPKFIKEEGRSSLRHTKKSFTYAAVSSAIVAITQTLYLISLGYVPVSVASPLATGISILVSVLVPWVAYHEKLTKNQILGAVLSLVGTILFVFE